MPDTATVVIVGGGVIGSSIALHLRERLGDAHVVVVERDPSYARASSRLATGGIRQQFDSPVDVAMAQHSVEYYARFDEITQRRGHRSRAWFRRRGYLFLADAERAEALTRRFECQLAAGARVERWTARQVGTHVPGLRTDDIALGIFGPDDGYLDPREVLAGFRAMAVHAGAEYVHGAVTGIERSGRRVSAVRIAAPHGERMIAAPVVVNAAGAYAAAVGALVGVSLPIQPVRQHLFRVELTSRLPSRIPMIFDPDGTHWRLDDAPDARAADRLVIGRSRENEPPGENFECDRSRFEDEMLLVLQRRYPTARIACVVEGWAGLYEMSPDQHPLLGEHPAVDGFVVAAGFSGHGLMMAPAVGVAVAELIAEGRCASFDIGALAADRFARGKALRSGGLV